MAQGADPINVFNVLIATDNHLGYCEKDAIRGEDSFNTFEEILQLAVEKDVDFILLGGDLFHDSKPSPKCLHKCMELLRKYCMGDKPISVEFLSNPLVNFKHCANQIVNYEDPNLNVSIPVYSIHGNHDDPSGYGRLSALDILSVSGLINYFGKWTDLTQIKLSPILLQKGISKMAIYGLSYIKDERLVRLLRDKKVEFERRSDFDDGINILVMHQNRADRGLNTYIKETELPDFFDLVIWGHEHECETEPMWSLAKQLFIIQPGSSVATSLCGGEAASKHVFLLKTTEKKFKLEPIKLQTVRPFIFDVLNLSEISIKTKSDKRSQELSNYVSEIVEGMLEKAQDQLTDHKKQPTLPLLRLRVEYTVHTDTFNAVRFGQKFTGRVANPTDLILLRRCQTKLTKNETKYRFNKDTMDSIFGEDVYAHEEINMDSILEKYFTEVDSKSQIKVLSVKGLGEAVARFITKSDKEALEDLVNHQVKKTVNYLKEQDVDESNIDEHLETFRQIRLGEPDKESSEARKLLESSSRSQKSRTDTDDTRMDVSDSSASEAEISAIQLEPVKRGRGRGSRGGGTRASGRARGSRGSSKASAQSLKHQTSIADLFTSVGRGSSSPAKKRRIMYESDDSS